MVKSIPTQRKVALLPIIAAGAIAVGMLLGLMVGV